MRRCVIFNPTAKGDKARHFRQHLGEIGADAVLKQTECAGDARRLAREAVGEGFDVIVAAGGDGTVNEVLNGMGDVPDGFARSALGVLPLGTVNVFARELQIPMKLEHAWKTVLGDKTVLIDLPAAEFASKGSAQKRCFAQLAGAGLDARAIELVSWPLKKKIGPLAYVVAGIHALRQPQTRIEVSDGRQTVSGELVLIGNGRLYGGQFALFPEAHLQDGTLDVCVFEKVNWLALARCGPSLLLKRRLPPEATINLRASSVTLRCGVRAGFELDGEWAGELPATISVLRKTLRVVVPVWGRHPISVRERLENC
jgi:lipid kinase, YegS/Rv2252/BmrU family